MKTRSDLPVELIQSVGSDHMLASAARVSTGTDLKETTTHAGLIRFLMQNRHGTPFEHGSMTFRVEAPIFVAREFMRHRVGWSYNEESGRYKVLDTTFYVPDQHRNLVQVGKAGHYTFQPGGRTEREAVTRSLCSAYASAAHNYHEMLDAGVAKEVARMCLPVGVYTSFYATCNPRSLMHFLSLRTKDETSKFPSYPQHEIEVVARGMEREFAALYPMTYEAYASNGRVAP